MTVTPLLTNQNPTVNTKDSKNSPHGHVLKFTDPILFVNSRIYALIFESVDREKAQNNHC